MKKLFLSTLMLLFVGVAVAQTGNVVIFSEGGERFTAILNGLRMNDAPATNVKVEALNQPGYKLKVIFEDQRIGEISKDIMVSMGEEVVYMVKLDKKGGYKVAWRSATPIDQAPPTAPSQTVYQWGAPVAVVTPAPAPVTVVTPAPAPASTVIVEETTTITTTGTGVGTNVNTGTGENVSMNVNVPGFGMNVNINTGESGMTTTSGSSTTTTTTTTTTTVGGGTPVIQPAPVPVPAPCEMLDPTTYERSRKSVAESAFADTQMTLAKQVTKPHCLSVMQIKGFMEAFKFEDSKLEYAKFAYHYCYDQKNYFEVNDAFGFSSSIDELDAYINAQR